MPIRALILATRPHYLLLPVVLVFMGTAMAWHSNGSLHVGHALVALVGLLLAHISANVLNDYSDFKSGIDQAVKRSPFNGGSGVLPAAMATPRQMLWLGIITFLLAIPVAIYFVVVSGWALLPVLLMGAFCIFLYTPVLTKAGTPEWAPGLGLGALPILGAYFVQTGEYTLPAVMAAVPVGILVLNLLLLNEFPDVEADRAGGRKTLPILLGKSGAGLVYSALTIAVYVWILGGVVMRIMPVYCLLAMLTLPLALQAIRGVRETTDGSELMPAMRANVLIVLLVQLLMGLGYILAGIL